MGELSTLACAVVEDDLERVRELVTQGHRVVWEPWPFDETALHFAADHGNAAMIAILVDAGGRAFIDALGNGWTPLGLAALKGHVEAVRVLLTRGADPNARDVDHAGESPLGDAVERGFEDIVFTLLAWGADPNAPGWMNLTPLDRAKHRSLMHPDEPSYRIERALVNAERG